MHLCVLRFVPESPGTLVSGHDRAPHNHFTNGVLFLPNFMLLVAGIYILIGLGFFLHGVLTAVSKQRL